VRDARTGKLYAEKVFHTKQSLSQLGRGLMYGACFQAPPPYGAKESAIRAALFRRKVLHELGEFWFGRPLVADACYSRWDGTAKAYILGTEHVQGRGPIPGQVNLHTFRHLWHNYPRCLLKMATGAEFEKARGSVWEIEEVATWLDVLKDKFQQAGFIGSQWQVDKALSVPTSNLLKDGDDRWILVDVESGLPALTLPRYLWRAIRCGAVPLFDDVDFARLRSYLQNNQAELLASLGKARVARLYYYVEQLEQHTKAWKESEPAVFSHRYRLLTDTQLRQSIKLGFIDSWQRQGRISSAKAQQLHASDLRFTGYLGWNLARGIYSGLSSIALWLKNLTLRGIGYVAWSLRLGYSAFFREDYLREIAGSYVNQNIDNWQKSGRLTESEAKELRQDLQLPAAVEYTKGFMAHLGLELLAPPIIGEGVLIWLAVYLGATEALAVILITPALRTAYTLLRMIKNRGKGISYGCALLVGALPKVGAFAYWAQMFYTSPKLSVFLLRCQAAKVGSHFPLFGGKDSRLEHLCIKMVDIVASLQYELASLARGFRAMISRGLRLTQRAAQAQEETCT